MLSTARASSDMRLGSHGGSQTISTLTSPTPGTLATAFSTINLVDQAQLVDIRGDFRIIYGLERGDDVIRQSGKLAVTGAVRRRCASAFGRGRRRSTSTGHGCFALRFHLFRVPCLSSRLRGSPFNKDALVIRHAKKSCALIKARARQSTSSRVL